MADKIEKFIALFDIHVGFEKKFLNGKTHLVPTHNVKAIKATLDFAKDFKPDIVVLGGDQLNFAPISHWERGKVKNIEGARIKEDMDVFDDLILSPIEKLKPKKKKWLFGNHDAWVSQFIEEFPYLEGLIEPENYFDLRSKKWDIFYPGEVCKVGKLNFVHGDMIRGGDPVKKAASEYYRNLRFGHFHTYGALSIFNMADSKDTKTIIACPSLSSKNPNYRKNAPNRWITGFLYGYIWPDGRYNDYVVIMTEDKFVLNSKFYGV